MGDWGTGVGIHPRGGVWGLRLLWRDKRAGGEANLNLTNPKQGLRVVDGRKEGFICLNPGREEEFCILEYCI